MITGWQKLVLDTPELLAQHFNGEPQNIGVLTGPPVDIDLDFLECLPFAKVYLPRTLQFGRASNPVSHWIYDVPDAPKHTRFEIKSDPKDPSKTEMVLEIRSGPGFQTVFPDQFMKPESRSSLWMNPNRSPKLRLPN